MYTCCSVGATASANMIATASTMRESTIGRGGDTARHATQSAVAGRRTPLPAMTLAHELNIRFVMSGCDTGGQLVTPRHRADVKAARKFCVEELNVSATGAIERKKLTQ